MTLVNIGRKHFLRLDGVFTREAGRAETTVGIGSQLDHMLRGKVAQRVRPDDLIDLVHGAARGHQKLLVRDIRAEIAGILERRSRDPEMDLLGARVPQQLDDAGGGGAADDGVIHQHHPLALDGAGHRVELDADAVAEGMRTIAEQALCAFDRMRIVEGEKLKADVLSKLENIEKCVSVIEKNSPVTVEQYRERLLGKLNEVLGSSGIDESRILTEAAIFADKIAVDEETVRLRSHISQLRQMLKTGSPIGRKIDFLLQEFNREANTTGSKCQNSDIAHTVVDLKSEIEKIREQIQNIE